MDVAVNEYQAPGATWSFDIANQQTQSATTTPTSPTLTTTGSNDVVVLITSPSNVTACVANLGQTFNLVNNFDNEGALAPEQRDQLAKLAIRAMLAGTMANLISTSIIGIFS